MLFHLLFTPVLLVCMSVVTFAQEAEVPNVLLAIADDQSYMHAGANGDDGVNTPGFDRVAREGVRFTHAYATTPSCTPSRSSILTGQMSYRLKEGGLLMGTLPEKFPVYPRMLEEDGYFIGYAGKGWGPGNIRAGGRDKDPLGKRFKGGNYANRFQNFLKERPEGKPFCFWYGAHEPHLPHPTGRGLEQGKELSDARLPGGLPDVRTTRRDLLDYYTEIEQFDRNLVRMLEMLEKRGELKNTLVIVTSDHGNPFPRSKCNLYDSGTRVPLAIRYPETISGKRVVDDFVSLTDLAPTILDYAGVEIPEQMTGQSLKPVLNSKADAWTGRLRDYVVTAFERHTWCRPGGATYPMRAIRTRKYLYIRNYRPGRWPAGSPHLHSPHQGYYGDVDDSPTKKYMIEHQDNPKMKPYFEKAFRKRPRHELYNVKQDPKQMQNLAELPDQQEVLDRLQEKLQQHLKRTGDPRVQGRTPWGDYPYYYQKYWKRANNGEGLVREFEGTLDSFLGEPTLEKQLLFDSQDLGRGRFPNVVVTTNGTILATWQKRDGDLLAKRSEDGGKTWGEPITIGPGVHGGGVTVDETSGDLLAFTHPKKPPRYKRGEVPRTMYRSTDDGKTWNKAEEVTFLADDYGNVPALHMSEHGITLRRGRHAGRLIRPARVFPEDPPRGGYNTAIYSDDGGRTWHASDPFPRKGTGEGTLAQRSDGRLYYNSRVHWKGAIRNRRRHAAWSNDGGESWVNWSVVDVLPDGRQDRAYGCMGGLVRLPVHDRDVLLFSNLDTDRQRRERVKVWASFDGGETWPVKRLVHKGRSKYSSLNAGRPGTPGEGWIYLQFEETNKRCSIARFNLSWVVQGERTGDGRVPEWARR